MSTVPPIFQYYFKFMLPCTCGVFINYSPHPWVAHRTVSLTETDPCPQYYE